MFGWQCDIDYILLIDEIEFKIGQVDGLTSQIYKDKVLIKIIQDSLVSFVGKNENIEIDAFSDKSLKGQDITPCQTHKIFFKPKPINQSSEWGEKILGAYDMNAFQASVMPIVNNLIDFGVETSFSPFDFTPKILVDFNPEQHSNRLLTTRNTLENVNIKIKKPTIKWVIP
jgi:hypothetical protein